MKSFIFCAVGLQATVLQSYSHISLNKSHCRRVSGAITAPNLDLLCVRQSAADPFCGNYANIYFDAKHLEEGLNRG